MANSPEYLREQKECGIERGDIVRVMRSAIKGERGWTGSSWTSTHERAVGKKCLVLEINCEERSVKLNTPMVNVYFPFFILSITKKGEKL